MLIQPGLQRVGRLAGGVLPAGGTVDGAVAVAVWAVEGGMMYRSGVTVGRAVRRLTGRAPGAGAARGGDGGGIFGI